jgi:hypothetical protein
MGGLFALLFAGGILTWIWATDAIGDTAFSMIGQLYPIYLAGSSLSVDGRTGMGARCSASSILVTVAASVILIPIAWVEFVLSGKERAPGPVRQEDALAI